LNPVICRINNEDNTIFIVVLFCKYGVKPAKYNKKTAQNMKKKSFITVLMMGNLLAFSSFCQETTATKPIQIQSYNHVGLAVKDLKVSATFYREILGLSGVDVPDNLMAVRRWFKIAPGQEWCSFFADDSQ
jgi:hypothetical protein